MQQLIAIKGGRNGLRLQLDETAVWGDLIESLRAQLEQGSSFFNGAQVVVDVGERTLEDGQMGELLEVMKSHGLKPASLASTARESRAVARSAGIAARPLLRHVAEAEERGDALLQARTVRSGQLVRHQGHIIILGDVNAGAEIVAGGNVIVWGRIRGTVHAGALGDRTSLICALDLRPTQLRIADLIGREPEVRTEPHPEVAYVQGEGIAVESWDAFRR